MKLAQTRRYARRVWISTMCVFTLLPIMGSMFAPQLLSRFGLWQMGFVAGMSLGFLLLDYWIMRPTALRCRIWLGERLAFDEMVRSGDSEGVWVQLNLHFEAGEAQPPLRPPSVN